MGRFHNWASKWAKFQNEILHRFTTHQFKQLSPSYTDLPKIQQTRYTNQPIEHNYQNSAHITHITRFQGSPVLNITIPNFSPLPEFSNHHNRSLPLPDFSPPTLQKHPAVQAAKTTSSAYKALQHQKQQKNEVFNCTSLAPTINRIPSCESVTTQQKLKLGLQIRLLLAHLVHLLRLVADN